LEAYIATYKNMPITESFKHGYNSRHIPVHPDEPVCTSITRFDRCTAGILLPIKKGLGGKYKQKRTDPRKLPYVVIFLLANAFSKQSWSGKCWRQQLEAFRVVSNQLFF